MKYLVMVVSLFLLSCSHAFAGLMTPTADILALNLQPGETYNLTKLTGVSYKVITKGMESRIRTELLIPTTEFLSKDFEAIPDISWITLTKTEFYLLPGETGVSDVIITIPNDPKLLGKKFQASIVSRTIPLENQHGGIGFGLGVRSSIRFSIVSKAPTIDEKNRFKNTKLVAANISLMPNDVFLENIPVGENFDVGKKIGKYFKLVNAGDDPVVMRLKCIACGDAQITIPEGWEKEPDTSFLRLKEEKVTVKPLEIKKVEFSFKFPKEEKYRNKKYLFIIDATTGDDVIATSYRSKVYVFTK